MKNGSILRFSTLCTLVLFITSACSNDSADEGTSDLLVKQRILSATAGLNGTAVVTFDTGIATSFQLDATTGSGTIDLLSLTGPTGDISGTSTEIAYDNGTSSTHVTNVPYVGGSFPPGSYTATYKVTDGGASQVRVVLTAKNDSDKNSGTIKVNFILVGPASGDQDIKNGLLDALDYWMQNYANAGISIDPAWYSMNGPGVLPDPSRGDSFYAVITASTRPDAINLVFSTKLSGTSSLKSGRFFGIPGAVPGPIAPSAKSVIAFSLTNLAGANGVFDPYPDSNETGIAGEEMGRLTALYLGLENIVTFSGNIVSDMDHLTDTPTCLNIAACSNQTDVNSNIMFPYPAPKPGSTLQSFYQRTGVTDQQQLALNSSVFVD